jgi:hypothetical protein
MTTPSSDSPFLSLYEIFPSLEEDPKDFLTKLTNVYSRLSQRINKKDIAIYENSVEIQNGQSFFGIDPQTKRDGFRKVLQTGILATGANNIAHGITFPTPNTYHFTRIYGVIENTATPLYVPIPNDNTHLEVNLTNAVVTIPAAYNGYSGIVVLEYVKTD